MTTPPLGPTAPLDDTQKTPDPTDRRRVPWRVAGLGLTSFGTPIGIWATAPLLGRIATGIETVVALAIIGAALFGRPELSERAFRLLRWTANRPEPPAPTAPTGPTPGPGPAGPSVPAGKDDEWAGHLWLQARPRSGAWINGVMSDERTARGPVERPR